ncbi:hypothetical protein Pmani_016601 [Petrolisthes manimaculis]|uniref:Uncharacterized protein n=1 Tax=Petrolisthes manimaculis TaxID=1843537 RepID=A0AAE1PRB3_9EUCA|nr:hypothetical protein Pmani_016601 [Petrolisthes manimaculis]
MVLSKGVSTVALLMALFCSMSTSYPTSSSNAKNTEMCTPIEHSVSEDFTDDCGTKFEEVSIGGVILYNATCSESIASTNSDCCHYFSDDKLPGTDKRLVLYCAPRGDEGYSWNQKITCND